MRTLFLATAAACTLASGAFATTINTISNVVFIVDESGSMSGEQAFLENTVIGSLDSELAAAGVTDRSYGVIGYGGPSNGVPRLFGSASLDDATDTQTNLSNLVTSGGFEDGYEAIRFALDTLTFTAGAAVNFILVTDEDRDIRPGSSLTAQSIQNTLTSANILLNVIVNNPFTSPDAAGANLLGVNNTGTGYLADGMGGYSEVANGTVGNGSGTTETDYVDVALATGGAAWDLNQLRAGGSTAESFTDAFIDIKVGEIISQPPTGPGPEVVPLPAAAWMLLAGIGSLGALSRRRKAA
ncbi:MAG: VPLPA-CTERM sorting domain-containing protein [Pseudomonadota bacterium]